MYKFFFVQRSVFLVVILFYITYLGYLTIVISMYVDSQMLHKLNSIYWQLISVQYTISTWLIIFTRGKRGFLSLHMIE